MLQILNDISFVMEVSVSSGFLAGFNRPDTNVTSRTTAGTRFLETSKLQMSGEYISVTNPKKLLLVQFMKRVGEALRVIGNWT